MSKYLSIDTEATGLEEGTYLIQLAFVPIDSTARAIRNDLAIETRSNAPASKS